MGEELALGDVRDIPVSQMQDPWALNLRLSFWAAIRAERPWFGRPMPQTAASTANQTWLPIAKDHLPRAGLNQAATPKTIYQEFAAFTRWRKQQPAFMAANTMTLMEGTISKLFSIVFLRRRPCAAPLILIA